MPKTFQVTAMKATEAVLKLIAPKGPGGFDFLSVKGKPVLTDVNTGRFNGAHPPKLFVDLYAPGKCWHCWKGTPNVNADIWKFWGHLQRRGIAFDPKAPGGPRGVFPLIFLRGLSGQYIAIANTDEEARAMVPIADECREKCVPALPAVRRGTLSVFKRADIARSRRFRRIWVQSPQVELLGNHTDALVSSLPLFAATVLRPEVDIAVIPGTETALEHWTFLSRTLGLSGHQCLVAPVPASSAAHLDDSMDAAMVARLVELVGSASSAPNPVVAAARAAEARRVRAVRDAGPTDAPGAPPTSLPDLADAGGGDDTATAGTPAGLAADLGYTLVPSSPGDSFQRWAGELVGQGMRVFGDQPDWLARNATRALMHRDIDAPETPSLVQSWGLPTPTPRGFLCRDRQALLKAWAELGSQPCTLRPCRLMYLPWEGSVSFDRDYLLRLYDFPYGPVVMEVSRDHKSVRSGTRLVSVPCLGSEPLGIGCADLFRVGKQITGVRSSTAPAPAQETMMAAVRKVLHHLKPSGPSSVVFAVGAADGEPGEGAAPPTLVDIQVGFFTREHYVALFLEEHAPPDCSFHAFQVAGPENLDVWSLWARLEEEGIALTMTGSGITEATTGGVYPLIYERGGPGVLLAIGESAEQVSQLKDKAAEVLVRPVTATPVPRVPWAVPKNGRRAIVAPRSATAQEACFAVALTRPGVDVAVVPSPDVNHTHGQYITAMRESLGLDEAQVIEFAPGEDPQAAPGADAPPAAAPDAAAIGLRANILSLNLGARERVAVVAGDHAAAGFDAWVAQLSDLPVGCHAEDEALWGRFGGKRMLYREMGADGTIGAGSVVEEIAVARAMAVPVAKGFACQGPEALAHAHTALGGGTCVVRPLGAHTCGEALVVVDDGNQLTLLDWAVPGGYVIEEHLDIDRTHNGVGRSFVIPFRDGRLLPDHAADKMTVGKRVTGLKPTGAGKRLLASAVAIADAVLHHAAPRTVGAVHFHSVRGKPVLAGLTLGPLDVYHVGTCFADLHGPAGCRVVTWLITPPPNATAAQLLRVLDRKSLRFVPGNSTRGVFPMSFVSGPSGSCVLVAVASSPLDATLLFERCAHVPSDLAALEGPRADPGLRPAPAPGALDDDPGVDLLLLRGADGLFMPEPSMQRNVVIGGGKVLAVLSDEDAALWGSIPGVKIVDASGCVVCPGIVDMHAHIQGGGGEAGPCTRTPEGRLSEFISGGVTTIVGITGTDGHARSLHALLAKARALEEEGMSAFIWTGNYACPPPTITGTVLSDIMTVEQCIGVGEIAVSDHRGSQPTREELVKVASQARVAGMLSGKCGLVHVHVGPGRELLAPLWDVVNHTDIPITTFQPTHMDRTEELIADGAKWLEAGGVLDFTGRSVRCREALKMYHARGLLRENVTVSSDACGSLPTFENGRLVAYKSADAKALLRLLRDLYFADRWPLERILPLMTSTPAKLLKLKGKGRIEVGYDADIILLSSANLKLKHVVAKGKVVKGDGWVKGGVFEGGRGTGRGVAIKPHVPGGF